MKLIRRWYWYISEFIKKYRIGLISGVIIGVVLFTHGQQLLELIPSSETTYVGRVGTVTLSNLPLDIQLYVSQGLTRVLGNGSYELALAESLNISDNGKTYTITLLPNLTWSNGEPLTAHDFSIELTDVTVEIPDERTLIFRLEQPFAPFPLIISQPILKRINTGTIVKKTMIIGTESYAITEITTSNNYLSQVVLESPTAKRMYRFYPTEAEAYTAFKLGRVDRIDMLTSKQLEDWPNTELIQNDFSDRYLTLFFNTADPDLQNKTVRQMLTYATPKRADDSRVISPISKNSWAYNPQVKQYNYSLETAQSMYDKLEAANSELSLQFELTTTPTYADIGQDIIESWQQLGVQASLKIVPFPDTNNYQMLLIGQQIPDDPDQYLLWHSTQPTNITKYQNPKIDKLLEDGRKELDVEERKQMYQEFQRFIVEDSPAAFLHELHTYSLIRI